MYMYVLVPKQSSELILNFISESKNVWAHNKSSFLHTVGGGAVVSWLVLLTLDWAVWVWALAGDIVCS